MSQDFKMRILTKKKVAVPPSANEHISGASNRDDSDSESRSIRHNASSASTTKLLRKGSMTNMAPGSISVQSRENPTNQLIKFQKSKIVTYEIC